MHSVKSIVEAPLCLMCLECDVFWSKKTVELFVYGFKNRDPNFAIIKNYCR